MSFQIDIEHEQALSAVFECIEKTCPNGLMRGVRQVGEAVVAAREIHHEAVGERHAIAFR
jgi:hypothetical protein